MDEDSFFATFSGMSGQAEYRIFSNQNASIPLMLQGRWLDAVCGEKNWDVALVTEEGEIIAALPFQNKRKMGLTQINTAPLTADSGPWLKKSAKETTHGIIAENQEKIKVLIGELPAVDRINVKLSMEQKDIQAFLWEGFSGEVMYTYQWELSDLSTMIDSANRTVRKAWNKEVDGRITKAELNQGLPFLKAHHPHWSQEIEEAIERLWEASLGLECWIYEVDEKPQSLVILVQDQETIYFLLSATKTSKEHSMAFYQLMKLLIKEKIGKAKNIDFMGSQQKNLAHVFRALGALPQAYYRIVKSKYRWMPWVK